SGCSLLPIPARNDRPARNSGSSSRDYRLPAKASDHPDVQFCNTHVSFEPPPCDEFTTSEPLRRATRVSPPGTIVIFSPNRTYGRKSTCRGSIRPFIKHG